MAQDSALLRIERQSVNQIPDRPADRRPLTSQDRVALQRLTEHMRKVNTECRVRGPELPVLRKKRDTTEVLIHIKKIDGQRFPTHQLKEERFLDVRRQIVQRQKGCHQIFVERRRIEVHPEMLPQILFICVSKVAKISADQQHGVAKDQTARVKHLLQGSTAAEDGVE